MSKPRPVSPTPLSFCLRFSIDQVKHLEALADAEGTTRASLVRRAVDQMLEEKSSMEKAVSK